MEPSEKLNWDQITHIDQDKLWNIIRRNDERGLVMMFTTALRHVPASSLQEIFGGFAQPHEVGCPGPKEPRPLLEVVRGFVAEAMRGKHYVEFDVNSKNCTEWSRGTQEFDAKLGFIFERCVEEAATGNAGEVVDAFERLFAVLREIDKCERSILFWADEGGVWELSIDWVKVVAGYARAISRIVSPEETQRRAEKVIGEFGGADRSKLREAVEEVLAGTG